MPELKFRSAPTVDCGEFDKFVEEVYGRKYSTVNGYTNDDRLGHNVLIWVSASQWERDNEYNNDPEQIAAHEEWVKEMKAKSPWFEDYRRDWVSFEDWQTKDGWDAHNDCPVIDEMVWHLRKDGYDVPDEFEVLVDW